jgi:hypothetical protein
LSQFKRAMPVTTANKIDRLLNIGICYMYKCEYDASISYFIKVSDSSEHVYRKKVSTYVNV